MLLTDFTKGEFTVLDQHCIQLKNNRLQSVDIYNIITTVNYDIIFEPYNCYCIFQIHDW